jgi:hypothetical protein
MACEGGGVVGGCGPCCVENTGTLKMTSRAKCMSGMLDSRRMFGYRYYKEEQWS